MIYEPYGVSPMIAGAGSARAGSPVAQMLAALEQQRLQEEEGRKARKAAPSGRASPGTAFQITADACKGLSGRDWGFSSR